MIDWMWGGHIGVGLNPLDLRVLKLTRHTLGLARVPLLSAYCYYVGHLCKHCIGGVCVRERERARERKREIV